MSINVIPSPDLFVDGKPAGSLCCVWKAGHLEYALTAAHVVDKANDPVVTWYGVDGSSGHGVTVGSSLWEAMPGFDLDAALVLIQEAGPFASTKSYPWAFPTLRSDWLAVGESVRICGKHDVVFAAFDRSLPKGEVIDGREYGRLLQFKYDDKETRRGDSGSPVISLPDQALIGIHVARKHGGTNHAWAIPIEDVIEGFEEAFPGFSLRP